MKSHRTNLHPLAFILAVAEPPALRALALGNRDWRTRAWGPPAFAATGTASLVNANRLCRSGRGFQSQGVLGASLPQ